MLCCAVAKCRQAICVLILHALVFNYGGLAQAKYFQAEIKEKR